MREDRGREEGGAMRDEEGGAMRDEEGSRREG